MWADFDPRREPLEVEIIREWQEDGGLFRLVRYRIGTFKGQPARMAAIYGFPADTTERLPAVMFRLVSKARVSALLALPFWLRRFKAIAAWDGFERLMAS